MRGLALLLACGPFALARVPRLASNLRRLCISTVSGVFLFSTCPMTSFANDLVDQLQELQSVNVEKQKADLERQETEMMTKELQYPPGKLIARGIITLSTDGLRATEFPYGLESASLIDSDFGNDDAALFILAVGREGPPVAAKKIKLASLTFPLVFEITTDDLLFPYTPEAWEESSLSKDSVAVTAIMNSQGKLSIPNAVQRIGFAISEPTVFAGTPQRTSASISVASKIDTRLYTTEELGILSGIDDGLDRIEAAKTAALQKGEKKISGKK